MNKHFKEMNERFNVEMFESLVWYCAKLQGTISPETWELIIAFCFDGTWIGGNKYMADVLVEIMKSGLTVKSAKKQLTKGLFQTIQCVESRIPIDNEDLLSDEEKGREAIQIFVQKREESFNTFGLTKMYKCLVVHYREDDYYYARLFFEEQAKYEEMDLVWTGDNAKPKGHKKNDPWIVKRNHGNASAYQTCFWSKKKYDKTTAISDIEVYSPFEFKLDPAKIMKEYAEQKYAKVQ